MAKRAAGSASNDDDDWSSFDIEPQGDTHVRNERATRTALRAAGREDLASAERLRSHGESWSWCGEYVHCGFLDVDHAVTSLRYCGGTGACKKCLVVIRKIVDDELAGKVSDFDENAKDPK